MGLRIYVHHDVSFSSLFMVPYAILKDFAVNELINMLCRCFYYIISSQSGQFCLRKYNLIRWLLLVNKLLDTATGDTKIVFYSVALIRLCLKHMLKLNRKTFLLVFD